MSIIQRNDPEYLKERTKILKLQIAHKKAEKEMLETMITAEPAMQTFKGFLDSAKDLDPGFMESLSNFVGIAKGAFQEGLSDALTKMNNTLFSQNGIDAMTNLGKVGAKITNIGFGELFRNLKGINGQILLLNLYLEQLNKILDAIIPGPGGKPKIDYGGGADNSDLTPQERRDLLESGYLAPPGSTDGGFDWETFWKELGEAASKWGSSPNW